jgi:hypothetical protein
MPFFLIYKRPQFSRWLFFLKAMKRKNILLLSFPYFPIITMIADYPLTLCAPEFGALATTGQVAIESEAFRRKV